MDVLWTIESMTLVGWFHAAGPFESRTEARQAKRRWFPRHRRNARIVRWKRSP